MVNDAVVVIFRGRPTTHDLTDPTSAGLRGHRRSAVVRGGRSGRHP